MSSKKPCQSVRRSKYDPGIWFVNSEEWQASIAYLPAMQEPLFSLRAADRFNSLYSHAQAHKTCPTSPMPTRRSSEQRHRDVCPRLGSGTSWSGSWARVPSPACVRRWTPSQGRRSVRVASETVTLLDQRQHPIGSSANLGTAQTIAVGSQQRRGGHEPCAGYACSQSTLLAHS